MPRGWLIALLLLQLATLGVLIYVFALRGQRGSVSGGAVATDSGAGQRALALELENRSLYAQAAEAWQEYLRGDAASSRPRRGLVPHGTIVHAGRAIRSSRRSAAPL